VHRCIQVPKDSSSTAGSSDDVLDGLEVYIQTCVVETEVADIS
jgi:hypothetical protein